MKNRKGAFIFFLLLVLCLHSHAQPGTWTWIHGSNSPNNSGNFGTQGVSSPTNEPPSLYEPCEWKDLNGNFWLFGGADISGPFADLWKYDPVLNEWIWMKGPGVIGSAGNYGIKGVASATNIPPGRSLGMASWVDSTGNLWMFGGSTSNGYFADLWKYEISTNEWTWIKGPNTINQTGIYGTQGLPDTNNYPASRRETSIGWTDNANDLWLFGGYSSAGTMNDLWRFNISANTWTWMKGSSVSNQPGVYGIKGIEAAANTPGARMVYSRWKDKNGNLWLFGGGDFFTSNYLNDLWRFNPVTNNWTWMKGSMNYNTNGVFGTQCDTSILNEPDARFENRVAWTDVHGNFWTFGGGRNVDLSTNWNDLWMYCISTNEWEWISGNNSINPNGSWGTLGVSSPANLPNGRAGAIGWGDANGHLYFFGGVGVAIGNRYNDLWRYNIDSVCTDCSGLLIPGVNLYSSDTSFCGKKCLDFFDISTNNPISWQWVFPGADTTSSTAQNPVNICYNSYGSFDVTLIACNALGCDTLILPNFINEFQNPAIPVVTVNFDTLFSTPAYSYQWYNSNGFISGATNPIYIYQQQGSYYVIITDSNGCAASSNVVATGIENPVTENSDISVHPDPNDGHFEIILSPFAKGKIFIDIFDLEGRLVWNSSYVNELNIKINLQDVLQGIYFIRIKMMDGLFNRKLLILKKYGNF